MTHSKGNYPPLVTCMVQISPFHCCTKTIASHLNLHGSTPICLTAKTSETKNSSEENIYNLRKNLIFGGFEVEFGVIYGVSVPESSTWSGFLLLQLHGWGTDENGYDGDEEC